MIFTDLNNCEMFFISLPKQPSAKRATLFPKQSKGRVLKSLLFIVVLLPDYLPHGRTWSCQNL